MIWRIWAFLSGAPLGILLLWTVRSAAGRPAVYAAALAGGSLMMLATNWVVRRRHARERAGAGHAMRAATAGWLAWPAVAAVRLDIGPGAWPYAAVGVGWVAYAFWRHVRSAEPAPGPGKHLVRWGTEFALGILLVLLIGGLWAATDGGRIDPDERTRSAALDIDSRLALGPERVCSVSKRAAVVLSDRGASPRLADRGQTVWFEAIEPDGRSQVQRLSLETGTTACWTCNEPGNNRRPSPHVSGNVVLFDSDRYASWRTPGDTEVLVISARGKAGPERGARRVTFHSGPDENAFYDPTGRGLVWLRGERGRASVRRATLQAGHGGILLANEQPLLRAGAGWVVPLAWSPDARALVAARGHGLGPRRGEVLDPATGVRRSLGGSIGAGGAAAFSADGALLLVAETSTIRAAALFPESLGFAVARLSTMTAGARSGLTSGTALRLGPADGELLPLRISDEVARWGEPTGVGLAPEADWLVLGQRRPDGAERLLRIDLDCRQDIRR